MLTLMKLARKSIDYCSANGAEMNQSLQHFHSFKPNPDALIKEKVEKGLYRRYAESYVQQ